MSPLDLLLWSFLVALAATGLTIILRNAPVIRGWMFELRKPWACNVCMPLYTSAALLAPMAYQTRDWSLGFVYLGAYFLSHITLEGMSRPPAAGPPPIPQLLDLDDIEEDD